MCLAASPNSRVYLAAYGIPHIWLQMLSVAHLCVAAGEVLLGGTLAQGGVAVAVSARLDAEGRQNHL